LITRLIFFPGSDFPYADSDKIAGFREELDTFKMKGDLREKIYHGNIEALLRQ
jgi:hypothetical protein